MIYIFLILILEQLQNSQSVELLGTLWHQHFPIYIRVNVNMWSVSGSGPELKRGGALCVCVSVTAPKQRSAAAADRADGGVALWHVRTQFLWGFSHLAHKGERTWGPQLDRSPSDLWLSLLTGDLCATAPPQPVAGIQRWGLRPGGHPVSKPSAEKYRSHTDRCGWPHF